MTNNGSPTEETGATPVAAAGTSGPAAKSSARDFLQAARRDLTDDEASSAAGRRWLIYEIERLDTDCADARSEIRDLRDKHDALRERHNEQKVELETLKARRETTTRNEILAYLAFAIGSAGIGAAPSYFSVSGAATLSYVVLAASSLLLLGGLGLRVWK